MILVTVGTHTAPFDRLVRRMDEIASVLSEPVVMQIGTSRIIPQHAAAYKRFYTEEEYKSLFETSRVVVSHAGTGTILKAILARKPLICVPRLKRFQEHWDDHQLEMCRALHRRKRLEYFENTQELDEETLKLPNAPDPIGERNEISVRIQQFLGLP